MLSGVTPYRNDHLGT